jgi:hypothetical protein
MSTIYIFFCKFKYFQLKIKFITRIKKYFKVIQFILIAGQADQKDQQSRLKIIYSLNT